MAYDKELAERVRDLLVGAADLTEQKMFGGLAFLVGGKMAVCVSGQGGILVRTDPALREHLLASTAAFPFEMGGRTMRGFVRVDADDVRADHQLSTWVERGATYARTLPATRSARQGMR